MIRSSLTRFERIVFLIALFAHLVASWYSFGFHHLDEHYQIWEWANYITGISPTEVHLPWEWGAQIRPWFQALFHAAGMKAALGMGIFEPFSFAFATRVLYAVANWVSLICFWNVWKKRENLSPYWSFFIATLWFFPYIHVRTSSENLAGIFLTFAFTCFLNPENETKEREDRTYYRTGLLFGFAFLARYQIALGLAGLAAFLLYRDRKILKKHLLMGLGFILPVIFGIVLDRIGYGNWVITAYRYFTVNLVQGVAATFNPYPWYQYFIWILELNPLVSVPLFVGTILYTLRKKFDALGAFIWTFFLIHCLIANKEYRFLFPILNLVPFMAISGIALFRPRFLEIARKKVFWIPYIIVSLFAFTLSSMRGAAINTLWVVDTVHQHFDPTKMVFTNRDYVEHAQTSYYTLPTHPHQVIYKAPELEEGLKLHPESQIIIDGSLNDQITNDLWSIAQQHSCKRIDSGYPYFIYSWRERLPFLKNMHLYVMYDCGKG